MTSIAARLPVVLLCFLAGCPLNEHSASGGIVVTADDSTLDAFDETTQLHAVEVSSEGKTLQTKGLTWSSSDPGIASVNASGLVTAHGNGTAVIRVESERDFAGTTEIVVEQVAVAIAITPEDWPTAQAWIGARRQFTVEAQDANGHEIANPTVDWAASDDTIIRIDADGLATAMTDGANVTVSAASGLASDSLLVTVNADGGNGPGTIYTIWYARSDDAPAVLDDGRIEVPDRVIANIPWTDPVPPWPNSRPTVHKFQWEGDRIGILTDMADGHGSFRVRNRLGEWINVTVADAIDFQLEGNWIGVRERGGRVRANDGTGGPWTELTASGAIHFQIEGNRFAVLHENGLLQVRSGIAGASTDVLPAGDAIRFQLEGNRIVVLHSDGTLRAKDSLADPWTDIGTNVTDFRLAGNRIAYVDEAHDFRVQDGLSDAPTVLSDEPLAQFELEGNRIGQLLVSGAFRVQDGIGGTWANLFSGDVRLFHLQGNRIGIIRDSDGVLRIKTGILGAWADSEEAYGQGVTQIRLLVDVPAAPFRTTPASYASQQQFCQDEQADPDNPNNCYHVPGFDLPVSNYGFYCGAGRPADFLYAVLNQPAIDSLDENCKHHDLIQSWYPESENGWDGDVFGACIVRYGITHGRLTRDGVLLTHGGESQADWDAGWSGAGMVNLKDALDNYFIHTDLCDSDALAEFTAVTASQN